MSIKELNFLLEVVNEQYPRVPPLSVIILLIRLRIPFKITEKIKHKFTLHTSICSITEKISLLFELQHASHNNPELIEIIESIGECNSTTSIINMNNATLPCFCKGTSTFKPFSQSERWKVQQAYYQAAKLAAWVGDTAAVPSHISSNAWVVELYISKITTAVSQYISSLTTSSSCHPVIRMAVVEVGAGHGMFSVLLAAELRRRSMADRIDSPLPVSVTVIATDFHTSAFEDLIELPWVAKLLLPPQAPACSQSSPHSQATAPSFTMSESCYLDFAECGDICGVAEKGLSLMHSGVNTAWMHGPSGEWNVVTIIGQYAFDSLPVDLFRVSSTGRVVEFGVDVSRKRTRKRGDSSPGDRSSGTAATQCSMTASSWTSSEVLVQRTIIDPDLRPAELMVDENKAAFIEFLSTFKGHCCSQGHAFIPYPGAAISLLQRIQRSFPGEASKLVHLLIGDYFIPSDDPQWRIEPPGADLPFISPENHIVALPLVAESMEWAFRRAFQGSVTSNHYGLCSSKFSVMELVACSTEAAALRLQETRKSSSFPEAGPNELMVLRELVLEMRINEAASASRPCLLARGDEESSVPQPVRILSLIQAIIARFSVDSQLFTDTRWLALRCIKRLTVDPRVGLQAVGQWLHVYLSVMRRHPFGSSVCLAMHDLLTRQRLQWLLAIRGVLSTMKPALDHSHALFTQLAAVVRETLEGRDLCQVLLRRRMAARADRWTARVKSERKLQHMAHLWY